MERGKKTSFILKQFKKKSKRAISKDYFTEFFYLNKERRVIEFLLVPGFEDELMIEHFFKEFISEDFRDFVELKVLNSDEEKIRTWYFDDESLVLVLRINWGEKIQEISLDIVIESFVVTVLSDKEDGTIPLREVDYTLLNDHIISFLTTQARTLSETFEKLK